VEDAHEDIKYYYHLVFSEIDSGFISRHEDAAMRSGIDGNTKTIYYENNRNVNIREAFPSALEALSNYEYFTGISKYIRFLMSDLNEFETYGFGEPWEMM
jgi:hypothetical protein